MQSQTSAAVHPGKVVDSDGTELATHDGVAGFTIGQRKGLGVALGEPRYVVRVEPVTSTVVLGRKQDLETKDCLVAEMSFVAGTPPESDGLSFQFRAHGEPAACTIAAEGADGWLVTFRDPQFAIAPGQAGVVYRGDEVVGGGTIVRGT